MKSRKMKIFLRFSEEKNFDWPKYLLESNVDEKLFQFDHDESIDEETNDLTENPHDQTTEIEHDEEKTIDDLEEQNW